MPPSNVAAVTVFFLLIAPGIVFQMLRERWRPAVTESVLRETSRILLASTVFTLVAVSVLSTLRTIWPSTMPDPGAWLREGSEYVVTHYQLIARTVLLEVLLALASASSGSWLISRKVHGAIKPVGSWFQSFRSDAPEGTVPYVRVRLKDGEVYGGYVIHYSEEAALADRELVLGPPLSRRSGNEESTALDEAWQRLVIVGPDIEVIWVSYVRRGAAP